jgi:hypothetical protein
LKAGEERTIENRPGPEPPNRLLTVTARREQDEAASIGQGTASAIPQQIVARP